MLTRRTRTRRAVIAATSMSLLASACGSSHTGTTAGSAAGGTPILIGMITTTTGPASSSTLQAGAAAQARVDYQNAHGGVSGHPITLTILDDASSPTGNANATKELLARHVAGIVQVSALTFASTQAAQKAGIPVVGSGTDGPEWGMQPNTNMFSLAATEWDPKLPQYALPPSIWNGVTRAAALGYAISPSSVDAAKGFAFSAQQAGIQVPYLNTSVPFGSVNATSIALQLRQKSIDGLVLPLDINTNIAVLTAARQAGVPLKVVVSDTGYGQPALDDPSVIQAGQGVYFPAVGVPVELQTPATKVFVGALASYAKLTGVPDYGEYEGWLSADLMIKGLQVAGPTITSASIIKNLRAVTSYDAQGLLPAPLDFTKFGQSPTTLCQYYPYLKGSQFVIANNRKLVCVNQLPNSDQAPSA